MVQIVPVETGNRGQYLAFREPLPPRRGTDAIGGFDDQQGLIAIYRIDWLEPSLKMGR